MKRILDEIAGWLFAIIVCSPILIVPAYTQVGLPFPGPGGVAGAASGFSGPLDVVGSATACYSLRACSIAAKGTKAINLCDHLGANCADISTNASTGKLNAPGTLGSDNCTSLTTCVIKIWYDQSGALACSSAACDASQATVANMPTLTFSCINSLPCAVFNGSTDALASPTGFPGTASGGTISYSNVSIRTGNFTLAGVLMTAASSGGTIQLNYRQLASSVQMFNSTSGQFISNITDSNYHVLQGVFNGASSVLFCGGSAGTSCSVAGVSNAISPGTLGDTPGSAAIFCLGNNASGGLSNCTGTAFFTGQMTEAIAYNGTVFNGTQLTNMTANQYGFWGPF